MALLCAEALAGTPVRAEVVSAAAAPGSEGGVEWLVDAPADARNESNEVRTPAGSDEAVFVWDEQQDVVLPAPLAYQLPGVPNPLAGPSALEQLAAIDGKNAYDGEPAELGLGGALPAGAVVRSHMLHFDMKGSGTSRAQVTVAFDMPIVAVITTCEALEASDALLGSVTPGGTPTLYSACLPPQSSQDLRRRGLDWDPPGLGYDGVVISEDRTSITVNLRVSNLFDQLRVITEGMLNGGHAFAILREGGDERICYLGDPGEPFPPALPEERFDPLSVDLQTLPAGFADPSYADDLLGSEVAVVGVRDAKDPSNVVFSTCFDPSGIDHPQVQSGFQELVGNAVDPADFGLIQRWLAGVSSLPGQCFDLSTGDADSFTQALGGPFGAALGVDPWVPWVDDRTLVTGFEVFSPAPGGGGESSVVPAAATSEAFGDPVVLTNPYPSIFTLDGEIRPLEFADIETETFMVFTKNGTELIVNLGDHDQLSGAPLAIGAEIPAAFDPDGLQGADVALVGFFMEDSVRPNLMFSGFPGVPGTLADGEILAAFQNLAGSTFLPGPPPDLANPVLGFIDLHSDLGVGEGRALPVGDPDSFASRYGCGAGQPVSAFGFSICGTIASASPLAFEIRGAAAGPNEYAVVSEVQVDPLSAIVSATGLFLPLP